MTCGCGPGNSADAGGPISAPAGERAAAVRRARGCRALRPGSVCCVWVGEGGRCDLMTASRHETFELWQRTQEALRATGVLLAAGFPDFAAARAYYAAFYAASALLLAAGKTFRSHQGAVALIHRDYVRIRQLPVDTG